MTLVYIHLLNGECFSFDRALSQQELLDAISTELKIAFDRLKLILRSDQKEDLHYFLVITDSPDFPFTDWKTYFDALSSSLMDPYAICDSYPRYYDFLENVSKADRTILLELLDHTNDPQTGFTGLVHALLQGSRYACDLLPHIEDVIDEMFRRGATWSDELCLLFANGRFTDPTNFEDDMGHGGKDIRIKASLLHLAQRNTRDWERWLHHVPDWDNIQPVYWEDMMEWKWPHYHLKATYLPYESAYRKALKFEYSNPGESDT